MKSFYLFSPLPILVGIWALTACQKAGLPSQVSLLKNGDIEHHQRGWDYKCYSNKPNSYTFEVSSEAASSPHHSLKISCNQISDESAFGYYVQRHIPKSTIPAGAQLVLRAKIKTFLVGPGMVVTIQGIKRDNREVFLASSLHTVSITGTQDFTEYSVQLPSFDKSIDNLSVYLLYLSNTTGTVYFDDESLTIN